jgi:hypothetical protein
MIVRAGLESSLKKIEPMWLSTVFGERNSRSQIAWFDRPSAKRARISSSRVVSASSEPRRPRRPSNARNDLRIDHGAAASNPADGVRELTDVRNAVLRHIADSLRRFLQQPDRVTRLDVLG